MLAGDIGVRSSTLVPIYYQRLARKNLVGLDQENLITFPHHFLFRFC